MSISAGLLRETDLFGDDNHEIVITQDDFQDKALQLS